jgi:hypothetical protein
MIKEELSTKSINMNNATADELKEAKGIVREKILAALMLNRANGTKYNDLKCSMAENYVTGMSEYPKSPEIVLSILNAYKPPTGWNANRRRGQQDAGGGREEGAMFAQADGDDAKS